MGRPLIADRYVTLWELDGTSDLDSIGYSETAALQMLEKGNTLKSHDVATVNAWHKINTAGATSIEIACASKILDKGTLTDVGFGQIRPVALGFSVDLGIEPLAVQSAPVEDDTGVSEIWKSPDTYLEMQMEIWPVTTEEGFQRNTDFSSGPSEGAGQGILPEKSSIADGDTVHWRFKISERTSGAAIGTESYAPGRMSDATIANTDVIWLALGLNHDGVTATDLTTTLVECKVVAVLRYDR
jgi:hypothetical protein